jgi:hypothetical protein
MCGAWIEAGGFGASRVEYYSFYDSVRFTAAVEYAEQSTYSSSRLSTTDIGKFFTSCTQTVMAGSNAIREAGKMAYTHLRNGVSTSRSVEDVLHGVGWLASHACDGPVGVGLTEDGSGFKASILRGSRFGSGELARSLFTVGEPLDLQNLAESANAAVNQRAFSSPSATISELEHVFEGATGRTDHASITLRYTQTPELDGLILLASQGRFDEAYAFLLGLAATCAFALDGRLNLETTGAYTAAFAPQVARATRPAATALGRLAGPLDSGDGQTPLGLVHVDNKSVSDASSVTWSQLRAQPVGVPAQDCVNVGRFLFADRVDQEHFDLMITPKLYDRLEELTMTLRAAVVHVMQNDASVLAVLMDAATVAADVESTKIRIAGAPRGSWAGLSAPLPEAEITSADGPMLLAVKAARAMFSSRMNLLFDTSNVCEGPAVYDSLTANAYVYPGGNCAHLLLGILRKPFADERYDNASLASRVGYIIAHELAHNSLSSPWNMGAASLLLSRYQPSVYSEAMADVIAALAIVQSKLATATEVCHHVSQLWCARMPFLYYHSPSATHPAANDRGDHLCATLADLGLM